MTDAELTVKNLRLLATHMETVPEDEISMLRFFSFIAVHEAFDEELKPTWCGTPACCIGHATTIIPPTVEDNTDLGFDISKYATRVFPAAEGTYWATSFSSYLSNDRTECVQRLNDTADLIEKEHVR